MRRTSFILLTVFLIGTINFACSSIKSSEYSTAPTPVAGLEIPEIYIDNQAENDSDMNLLGSFEMTFNANTIKVSVVPERHTEAGYNATGYIPAPVIQIVNYNQSTGILDVDVTLKNPFPFSAYDVRLIVYTDNLGIRLTNEDNFTSMYDIPGGSIINPFKVYAKSVAKREFAGSGWEDTQQLKLFFPYGISMLNFAVIAHIPGNCEEPYSIENFKQSRLKETAGSTGIARVDILDWQDDVKAVWLYCPSITGQAFVPFSQLDSTTWELILVNEMGTSAGDYTGVILATSGNSGQFTLYDVVTISVYENITAKWTIFYYAYEENLYGLRENINEMEVVGSKKGDLNMIVCWDITGTTDDAILHIQRDPGGLNNTIISPRVEDFGEVIPPEGLDMPNPEQLTKFLKFAMREFPAEKYGFIMLSHGNYGIYYHVPDRSFLDDMGVWEFNDAVLLALEEFPEVDKLDFVGLENCTMSFIEAAYGMRECTKIAWASEYLMYLNTVRYDQVLAELLGNIHYDEYQFANLFCHNAIQNGGAYTYAAWDSQIVETTAIPAVNELAQQLINYLPVYRTAITECRTGSDNWGNHCEDWRITDLGYFCENLMAYAPSLPTPLTNAASAMRDAISASCFFQETKNPGEGCYRAATGWQILFTDQFNNPDPNWQVQVRDVIQNIGFADATLWDEFMIAYDDTEY
ncbi:MAG: clostripain-related cysteine peptidase [bacterium]